MYAYLLWVMIIYMLNYTLILWHMFYAYSRLTQDFETFPGETETSVPKTTPSYKFLLVKPGNSPHSINDTQNFELENITQ